MVTFRTLIVAMLASVLLVGCAHRQKIVGVWDIKGGPGSAAITFTADGNFNTQASMPGKSSTTFGQYKLDGNTLTLLTNPPRTATLRWNSEDEAIMTGDDGKAMTIARRK